LVRTIGEVISRCMNRDMKHVEYNEWSDYDSCPNLTGSNEHNDASIGYVIVNETTTTSTTNITTQEVSINPAVRSPSAKNLNKSGHNSAYKDKNKRNGHVKFYQEEIELLNTNPSDENCTLVQLGNRELPIDCYPSLQSNQIISKYGNSSMFNKNGQKQRLNDSELKMLNNALIERIKSDISQRQAEIQTSSTGGQLRRSQIEILDDNYLIEASQNTLMSQFNHQARRGSTGNRRSLIRNSSLSTISEEKTVITLDENNSLSPRSRYEVEPTADNWATIKRVINEFENVLSDENRAVLLEEFRKVFEASSKDGNFCRNVPIRISSPFKSLNRRSLNASVESSPHESISDRALSPVMENISIECEQATTSVSTVADKSLFKVSPAYGFNANFNRLVAKKMRFVKRLKNRIETRRGRPLVLPPRSNSFTNFASENRAMSRSNSAYKWLANSASKAELDHDFSADNNNNSLNYGAVTFDGVNQNVVVPKSDVKPVFF
jgi:hypothetical protein